MKYYVRCRTCIARRVFKRHPDEYIRLPLCKTCGTNHKGYRVVKLTKTITCYCNGYPYPHRYLSPQCNERTIAEVNGEDWTIYKCGFWPLNGIIRTT